MYGQCFCHLWGRATPPLKTKQDERSLYYGVVLHLWWTLVIVIDSFPAKGLASYTQNYS